MQPSLADIAPGDQLALRLWHFELTAPNPGEGFAAILIDGAPDWEARVPIPSDSGMLALIWEATAAAPAGTEIVFHLSNHGQNAWSLIELSVAPVGR